MNRIRTLLVVTAAFALLHQGCAHEPSSDIVLTAERPLHLEDHLDVATLTGSWIPAGLPAALEWRFDRPQPDWTPIEPIPEPWEAVRPVRVEDALRLPLTKRNLGPGRDRLLGGIYVALPDSRVEDWAYVEIRARTQDPMLNIGLNLNYSMDDRVGDGAFPFFSRGDRAPLVTDGTIQTYRLSLDSPRMRGWDGPWTELAIWFNGRDGEESATLDLLSVRVVPREAKFAHRRAGVELERRVQRPDSLRDTPFRRSLYMHAPGRIAYRVAIPKGGRLDVGLGVLRNEVPVTFRITAEKGDGDVETLLDAVHADAASWGQHSLDLSHLARETVTLVFAVDAERSGETALWAVPTLSGVRSDRRPNIILYVIDGAGADYMSLYGYNRRTTPNLERIAAQGAVFERAYSNSAWTRTSTPSFLTSLQHSVLGGLRNGRNPVPEQVATAAEQLHRGGYQTAAFTSNSNAGRMSKLERGVDFFRDAGVENWSTSSVPLHENYWDWRELYPAEPYWVRFQPTDVHNDHHSVAPFAGLYVEPSRRRQIDSWVEGTEQIRGVDIGEAIDQLGVKRVDYWSGNRDLHDETMAHLDHQLGKLVERLEASGEWERTLLIVAADHSVAAGSWDYALLTRDPQPEHVYHDDPATPMLRRGVSGIPLIFVWPGHIAPGQRFRDPVSMIDVLPTVLDLTDLPRPTVMQGQSLAPLLLGQDGWEPRPVILDEFTFDDETGELHGRIEVVDGRWGASLLIDPSPQDDRPAALLLYDLWTDPDCLYSLHSTRPDLVTKYTEFLQTRWEAHQALAMRFTRAEEPPLSSEQLETLRSLGYLR